VERDFKDTSSCARSCVLTTEINGKVATKDLQNFILPFLNFYVQLNYIIST